MNKGIGFIGLGVMGEPICRNLALKCGASVLAYDRDPAPLARLEGSSVVERTLPLSELIVGPGQTLRKPNEIMTRLELHALPGYGAAFEKVGHRRSMVISTVCLAALVKLDGSRRRIEDARIAIGAVGPVPERLDDVEDFLAGRAPTPQSLREAAEMAVRRVRSRSRQAYRREVLVNFVERALIAAMAHGGLSIQRLPKETGHV